MFEYDGGDGLAGVASTLSAATAAYKATMPVGGTSCVLALGIASRHGFRPTAAVNAYNGWGCFKPDKTCVGRRE